MRCRSSVPRKSAIKRAENLPVTLLRSFVTLRAACHQESGMSALILARFYMSPPAASVACGLWLRNRTGWFLTAIVLSSEHVVNSLNVLQWGLGECAFRPGK